MALIPSLFPSMQALIISQAKKNYGPVQALGGIDLSVRRGEFFGLLGPNGAGKTTLIQCVVGLTHLTSGTISVFGHNTLTQHQQSKQFIGYSPQDSNFERYFDIQRSLEFQAGYFGIDKNEQKKLTQELLKQFNLESKAKTQFYRMSGGMQKRALIAKALVSKPKLLILDEPTAGVDVEQRHDLWDYLKRINRDGTTIILTTHYIDEAEILCERIGIIHQGLIRELGTPQELIGKHCVQQVTVTLKQQAPVLKNSAADFKMTCRQNKIIAEGENATHMIQQILHMLAKLSGIIIEDIAIAKGSLEDVFLNITGEKITEVHASQN